MLLVQVNNRPIPGCKHSRKRHRYSKCLLRNSHRMPSCCNYRWFGPYSPHHTALVGSNFVTGFHERKMIAVPKGVKPWLRSRKPISEFFTESALFINFRLQITSVCYRTKHGQAIRTEFIGQFVLPAWTCSMYVNSSMNSVLIP